MFDLVASADTQLSLGLEGFLTILLLIFGLFMILAGAFTAYFGSGKSRTIGIGLLALGIVIGLLGIFLYHYTWHGAIGTLIFETFLILVAAVIGALIAVAIFLVAIMKS
jgi:uncharacterized membrane protein